MPKTSNNYSEDQLQQALHDISQNKISKRQAAKQYGVPRSTLQFRLGPKFVKIRPGPNTILSKIEEETIVEWIMVSQRKGFPKRKEDVLYAVKEFLELDNRDHPFGAKNTPGDGWFKAFLRRHPTIVFRTPDPVTPASAVVGESNIKGWFDEIESFLKETNSFDILDDPDRVFNGDETNFLMCPKTKTVLAAKGAKNIYEVDRGAAKENLTVMFTFSASGTLTPPMVIYPYKRVPENIRKSLPKGWGLGCSDNGWMTKEVFYEYVSKVLHPFLVSNKTKFPIIYFVDGHSTHLTLPLSKLCVQLGIILVALYPNATRILQPADVAAFKPMKTGWKKTVLEWRRNNPGVALTKDVFAPLLKVMVDSTISRESVQNGFKACGIFPWNKNSIKYEKCLGKSSVHNLNVPNNNSKYLTQFNMTDFSEIVGEEKIFQFETISDENRDVNNFSEDYLHLYEIFLRLKKISGDTIIERDNVTLPDINAIEDFIYEEADIENSLISLENCKSSTIAEHVNEPVPIENCDIVNIDNYLEWPTTPVRKGNKPLKPKKPFVITSPLWLQSEILKKEEKKKVELEKENRKLQRLEKREKTHNQKLNKTNAGKVVKKQLKKNANAKIFLMPRTSKKNEITSTVVSNSSSSTAINIDPNLDT